jgi:hypothetical protein
MVAIIQHHLHRQLNNFISDWARQGSIANYKLIMKYTISLHLTFFLLSVGLHAALPRAEELWKSQLRFHAYKQRKNCIERWRIQQQIQKLQFPKG